MQQQHKAKKSLGQNFLSDKNIVAKIMQSFSPDPEDLVLEIGPGRGVLTAELVKTCPHLSVVELDRDLAAGLQTRFGPDLRVMTGDILKCDITALAASYGSGRLRVIGNIPYYITSPILFHLIEHRAAIADATIMMQLEVARRLVAAPGSKDYGILAVAAQTYTVPQLLFRVAASCFTPRPRVTSAVVRFLFRDTEGIAGLEESHRLILRTAFNQRRKMLRNALEGLFGSDAQREQVFQKAQINDTNRAETLTTEDFIRLARAYRESEEHSGAADPAA